jgi:hypothetical protein
MHREIYTHQMLTALQHPLDQRERQMRSLAGMASAQSSLTRRTAHRLGSLFFRLGTRLMAYGANRPDARTGVDLRYS